MFFYLSKIFWLIVQPANLMLLLLGVAGLLLWLVPRAGRVFTIGLVVCVFALGIAPIGVAMLKQLENKYPIPTLPGRVDGIIVLGGFGWAEGSEAHHQIQVGDGVERFLIFAELARKYPAAKLVFTAGSGNPLNQNAREADYIRQLWTDLGYDPARVIWERDSRNTYENAVASKALAHPQPGENWVLITSARHMPRAVAIFEKQNWKVIPYPVDYITVDNSLIDREFNFSTNLWFLNLGLKENIGLWIYQKTGKAD